jgi:hypothetical protein
MKYYVKGARGYVTDVLGRFKAKRRAFDDELQARLTAKAYSDSYGGKWEVVTCQGR